MFPFTWYHIYMYIYTITWIKTFSLLRKPTVCFTWNHWHQTLSHLLYTFSTTFSAPSLLRLFATFSTPFIIKVASKAWQNAGGYIVPYVKTSEIDAYMGEEASYQSSYPQFCRPERLPRLEDDYILPGTSFVFLALLCPTLFTTTNVSLFILLVYSLFNTFLFVIFPYFLPPPPSV